MKRNECSKKVKFVHFLHGTRNPRYHFEVMMLVGFIKVIRLQSQLKLMFDCDSVNVVNRRENDVVPTLHVK